MIPSILIFEFDQILGPFLLFGVLMGYFFGNKVPMNYVHKMVGVSLGRSGIYIDRKTPSPQLKGLS